MNKKKQLRAEIAIAEQILQERHLETQVRQGALEQSRMNCSALMSTLVLLPAVWLGWKASRKKWVSKTASYLTELGLLSLSAYVKAQLVNYLTNQRLNGTKIKKK